MNQEQQEPIEAHYIGGPMHGVVNFPKNQVEVLAAVWTESFSAFRGYDAPDPLPIKHVRYVPVREFIVNDLREPYRLGRRYREWEVVS